MNSNQNFFSTNQSYIDTHIKSFPKTRYYGSKKRLLPFIYQSLKDYEFDTVLDGFGGTGSVSLLFQAMGKKVAFSDALMSNRVSANTLLNNKFLQLNQDEIIYFFMNTIPNPQGTISRHYKNIFFTDSENAWLDGALKKIHSLDDKVIRDLYLYFIFQAALMKRPFNLFHRANLYLRLNENVKRSFGNLTTWNRSFIDTINILVKEYFKMNPIGNKAEILDATNIEDIPSGYDLVYLDPPYIQKEKKDTYWKKYHFLEGMANYPSMESMIENHLKIKQLKTSRTVDDWETPVLFKEKLFKLVQKHRKSIVALSYVSNAMPSEDELLEFFKDNFSEVKIGYADLSHAMSKRKKTEILVAGVPL